MNETAETTLEPTDVAPVGHCGIIAVWELPAIFTANCLPESTNCLTCTEDGRFLGLGHRQGLSVWCASNFNCVAEWIQPQLEITFIQMTRIAEMTYLLGTVDDMGVSRVFGLYSGVIHLLSAINIMEDINIRSIFVTFEMHEGGQYGAASVSCNSEVWLEIYQFPVESWQRELQMEPSQQKGGSFSEGLDVKWSPVTLILKISPPTVPTEKASDFMTHCLALDITRGSRDQKERSSFRSDAGKNKKTHKSPSSCTQHFLLPSDKLTVDSEAGTDVTHMPEMLWPNAKDILCSAVSRCTRYIALGLEDALVCIWDRRSGAPLSILLVPEESSPLNGLQFLKNWSVSVQDCPIVPDEPVGLLLLCKSGAVYTVITGQGMQSCTKQLTERPKEGRDLPTVIMIVPFLQGVSLVLQRSCKMFLKDVINRSTVCNLTLPTSYRIASPCNPVYALNDKQQALFIRGDPETSCSDLSRRRNQSQLFVFRFNQSDIIKPLIGSHLHPPGQQTLCTLEGICNLYLEQRSHSVDERNKAFAQILGKVQETAAAMQQTPQSN